MSKDKETDLPEEKKQAMTIEDFIKASNILAESPIPKDNSPVYISREHWYLLYSRIKELEAENERLRCLLK